MKILFLVSHINKIGGIERVILDLSQALSEKGNSIKILCYSRIEDKFHFQQPKNISVDYLSHNPLKLRYSLFKAQKLRKKLKILDLTS